MTRANWIFVTLALALAACAKPPPRAAEASGAKPARGEAASTNSVGDAALDWSTLPAPTAAAPACVLFPATGQHVTCLASDQFGCIHYGDVCTPAK